jgi:hypothetical protein
MSTTGVTAAEVIPFRRDDAPTSGGAGFIGASIVLVGLGAFAFWALRRKQQKQGGGIGRFPWLSKVDATQSPRSVGRTVLSPQVALHVVEWRGEELLLACTSQSISVVARHPASKLDAVNESVGQ